MKAKEYFAKYDPLIMGPVSEDDHDTAAQFATRLLMELSGEAKNMATTRNARTNSALGGIIRELNDRWNAIYNLFMSKYGVSPIKMNGIKAYWIKAIPELADYI